MKFKNFYRLTLAIFSLVLTISLLAACGDEVTATRTDPITHTPVPATPTVTAAPATTAAPTATPTPAPTTAALPTVTTEPSATPAPTATTAPIPTPTIQPVTTTVAASPTIGATVATTTKPASQPAPTVKGQTPASTAPKLPGKIVYESFSKIYITNPDGSGLKHIADGHSPAFSPDGKRVAFISLDDSAINTVATDGTDLQIRCPTEGQVSRIVRWSPDGKNLAIYSKPVYSLKLPGQIQLCDMTYKGLGPLTTVYRGQQDVRLVFDWSVDGEKILWQSGSYNSAGEIAYDLWYSRPNDPIKNWDVVTGRQFVPELDEGYLYQTARISPTNKTVAVVGSQIFFTSMPGYKSSLDGLVVDDFENVEGIAWSPDSAALAVNGDHNGDSGLFLRYFDTGQIVRIAPYYLTGGIDWSRK